MNIHEQMGQLGEIAGVGYSPTDADVEQLIGRTRRSRGIRQGSTAVMGSIGAVALGVFGAQLFMGLNNDQDASMRDGNAITNGAYLNLTWEQNNGSDYTGSGQTREEIVAAWKALHEAAAVAPQEVAPAAQPPASTETHPKTPPTTVPNNSFILGNPDGVEGQNYRVLACELWTDAATGTQFWGAWSGSGWDYAGKMAVCEPGNPYYITYKYMGNTATINSSTRTCTGQADSSYKGAPHRISCRTNEALASIYGEWYGANDGNSRWTLNNADGKVLSDPGTFKWFQSGRCSAGNSIYTRGVPQCNPVYCDGWYYRTSDHPVKDGHTYSWNGSTWVQDPEPTPTPTETTPPPDPEPTPSSSTPPA